MKQIIAGYLNPRDTHDGWALLRRGHKVPDPNTFSTTKARRGMSVR